MALSVVATLALAGLVLGYFVALGRSAAPADAQHPLRTALVGLRRLQDLRDRTALPPWDDLDKHFPGTRAGRHG